MSGKSYTYNQCDPKADVVTSEGSASGIQTSVGTAPLVQPATGTSEVDQVVESKELGNVAKAIENFWDEFAVELDPVLFQATGNIQTIKNIKDFATPIMEAHVMLEKWRDAKDKDATRRPLIETLCKMGKVKQANDIFGQSLTDFVWLHMTDVTDGPLPPDKQRDPVTAKPDPGNGKASGKAEATPTVAGFSQAPEFDAALDGPVPRECLISVAQAVADSWEYLAVFLDPELFDGICRNDIKFQYPQDSFMQSVTMLGKWQDHLHGNCRRLISALCEMNRKDIAIREFGERLVEFLLQKPEHSHATPTVKAGPQQPQSAMQVESDPDMTGNAGNKLTKCQIVEIANKLSASWQKIVLQLDPDFFDQNKRKEIEKTESTPFLQAEIALNLWRDHHHKMATQDKVIKALRRAGFTTQAVEVFGSPQVDDVASKQRTIEGSASETQKPAPLVQPATRTSEADQVVEDVEITKLAEATQGFWNTFAVKLDSCLFTITGNIQAIKDNKDYSSPTIQAQVMLEKWRDDKGKNATRRLLIETLCNMGKRKQANDVFGEFLTDFVQKPKTNVIDGPLPPDKQTEHSHATLTGKAGPQQPQSDMQVESAPDTTGNAGNKLTLDQLKLVGLGKGVKFMNLSPMKEIVTPDQNNIIRKPSVASNIDIAHDLEFLESEFAEGLELSFRTEVAQALHCSVLFMNDEHRSSKHRRRIYVAKVSSETVDFSDELPHSSSIPFVNSLKEAAKKKYPDSDLDDRQRDEICKDVIENVYQGTTHFISSVELGVMYSIVTEEKETTGGKKQGVLVSADINTFIKAKLEGGVEIKREELEKKLNVKTLEKSIGIVGADGKPKEMGRIGCKVRPIWSVIKCPDWRESVRRACSKILPVPVGEKNPIVIEAAGPSPRYLKVSKVNSAVGAKKQRTSKWRVEGTAEKSKASKIYVVTDGETNDGDGGTVISLYTEIDDERIFLTPENGILAAKGCQSGKESKFVLVEPRNCDRTCDVREWQSRQPLCIRQAERKLTFPCFGFSSPQFVAFSTNEGSDSTPVMKTARDISSAEDWTSQFLIEPANII